MTPQRAMEIAKNNLVNDGRLAAMALCFGPGGVAVVPAEFGTDDEKWAFYRALGAACRDMDATRVVLVNDAAMKTYDPGQYDMHHLDPTETPLTYPKSMRTEVIMVMDHALGTDKTEMLMQPYRDADGKVEFLPVDEELRNMKFESGLVECVEEGFRLGIGLPEVGGEAP